MAAIGEKLDEKAVIGVGLSKRSKDTILEVWLKNDSSQSEKVEVSKRLRKLLQLDPNSTTLYYKSFSDAAKDGSTLKNALGYKFARKQDYPQSDF